MNGDHPTRRIAPHRARVGPDSCRFGRFDTSSRYANGGRIAASLSDMDDSLTFLGLSDRVKAGTYE